MLRNPRLRQRFPRECDDAQAASDRARRFERLIAEDTATFTKLAKAGNIRAD
jgi:hypothetical protein